MKKIVSLLLLCYLIFVFNSAFINCETYDYPFESIRITEALKFNIMVEEEPAESSYLHGKVQAGDTLAVYVGVIEMFNPGIAQSNLSRIVILSDADNNDLLRWIVNSGMWSDTTESLEFSSHIQIDPEFGVRKDLTLPPIHVNLIRNLTTDSCTFIDDVGTEYAMIPGSYEFATGLDILIAANAEVEG